MWGTWAYHWWLLIVYHTVSYFVCVTVNMWDCTDTSSESCTFEMHSVSYPVLPRVELVFLMVSVLTWDFSKPCLILFKRVKHLGFVVCDGTVPKLGTVALSPIAHWWGENPTVSHTVLCLGRPSLPVWFPHRLDYLCSPGTGNKNSEYPRAEHHLRLYHLSCSVV